VAGETLAEFADETVALRHGRCGVCDVCAYARTAHFLDTCRAVLALDVAWTEATVGTQQQLKVGYQALLENRAKRLQKHATFGASRRRPSKQGLQGFLRRVGTVRHDVHIACKKRDLIVFARHRSRATRYRLGRNGTGVGGALDATTCWRRT
jgi:hypothetical protein